MMIEIARAGLYLSVMGYLWWIRCTRADVSLRGWSMIGSGIGILVIASVMDVTDNYPWMARYVVLGPTPVENMLEEALLDPTGLVLLCIGLMRWLPTVTSVEGLRKANAEIERVNAELRRASETKDRFLANMSHEIRTPLTAILGYADLINDRAGEHALVIRRNAEHLIQIINDILDLSKVQAGEMKLERIACSPAHVVEDAAAVLRPRADAKGLTLSVRVDAGTPASILSDPTRLRQALLNLMGNAIKFTEHGGVTVTVRAASGGDPAIEFEVHDTGPGIEEARLPDLFRPFTQGDASTARRFGGTGLGLTISRHLAELLGGAVTVQSVVGRGSTFTLRVAAEPTPAPASAERIGAATAKLRGRILVAEDGADVADAITQHLTRAGAEVVRVANGREAVEAAAAARRTGHPPDLILMDMQMPVMDGYAAVGALRRDGFDGPIVALTAHAMADERAKCIAAGCDDYASKPFRREELLSTCARWMAKRQAAAVGV